MSNSRTRLPKRGFEDVNRLGRINGYSTNTFTVSRPQGGRVEFWFDRRTRSWAVIPCNADGHQIGQSHYVASRSEAISIARHLAGQEVSA